MKKVILGTTALVAATALTAGTASAADPIKLELGGYLPVRVTEQSERRLDFGQHLRRLDWTNGCERFLWKIKVRKG